MRKTLFALSLCLVGALFAAAGEGLPKVVVEDFVNKTAADDATFDSLKRRIENEIINTRKFNYLERGESLRNATKERARVAASAVGEGEAAPLPALKRAGYSIYGEILFLGVDQTSTTVAEVSAAKFTAKVEISLRLADIETGEVLASKIITATRSASRTVGEGVASQSNYTEQGLNEAIAAAAKQVVAAIMELAYPTKVLLVNARAGTITVNLTKEQTAVGKLYELFSVGEVLIDPDTGESLGSAEEYIGRAKVVRAMPKFAQLEPADGLDLAKVAKGMVVRPVDEATLQRERQKAAAEARAKRKSRF